MSDDSKEYGLSPEKKSTKIQPPQVDYSPPSPREYNPPIALIGTGGISEYHLKNYKDCNFRITALANRTLEKAKKLRDQFFPDASIHQDYQEILEMDQIQVVDVTTHPNDRIPIIYNCLKAGKHTLSQKPFTLDLMTTKLSDLHLQKANSRLTRTVDGPRILATSTMQLKMIDRRSHIC